MRATKGRKPSRAQKTNGKEMKQERDLANDIAHNNEVDSGPDRSQNSNNVVVVNNGGSNNSSFCGRSATHQEGSGNNSNNTTIWKSSVMWPAAPPPPPTGASLDFAEGQSDDFAMDASKKSNIYNLCNK